MNVNRVTKTLMRAMLTAGMAASLGVTLQGCVLAVAGAAAAGGGALVATDRRTVGMQALDREIQVKAYSNIANTLPDTAHVNVTVLNRRVLLTGEVPDQTAKDSAEKIARGTDNAQAVVNELMIGPKSDFSARANDTYLVSRVKTALVAEKGISANHFKVVGERGNIYLMGLVTTNEGSIGANVASRVTDVQSVVKVFEYVKPDEAEAAPAAAAAREPSYAPPEGAAGPTAGAVPSSSINAQPLQHQAPSPVTDEAQVRPGNATSGK